MSATNSDSQSFLVTYGNNQYYAVLKRLHSEFWTLLIGGKKNGCIQIDITKVGQMSFEGYMTISYDKRCNVAGDLSRGTGTIAMLNLTIAFCFHKFPKTTAIYFKDQSEVSCGLDKLPLPTAQLAEYGKTWYMRKIHSAYDVVTDSPQEQTPLDKFIQACREPKGPFEPFWTKYILPRTPRDFGLRSDHKLRIQKYWTQHSTLQSMIASMKKNGDCVLFLHWLRPFYTTLSGNNIEEVDFKIIPIKYRVSPHFTYEEIAFPYEEELRKRQASMNRKMQLADEYMRQHGGRRRETRWTFGKDGTLADAERR